jgi:hypothetical protein
MKKHLVSDAKAAGPNHKRGRGQYPSPGVIVVPVPVPQRKA